MKIILLPIDFDSGGVPSGVALLPDHVIINSGKQFFPPSWMSDLSYIPLLLVRMERVAKSLDSEYAERYYERGTLGFSLTAGWIGEELPAQFSFTFEGSIVRGDEWKPIPELVKEQFDVVQIEGAKRMETGMPRYLKFPDLETIDRVIAQVSKYCMLKIGDMLAFPLWNQSAKIVPDQGVFITDHNENELLYFGVK